MPLPTSKHALAKARKGLQDSLEEYRAVRQANFCRPQGETITGREDRIGRMLDARLGWQICRRNYENLLSRPVEPFGGRVSPAAQERLQTRKPA